MECLKAGTYCEKVDGQARWFGTGVAAAFFATLERCSCVNLNTYDTDEEDGEEAKDRPLMLAAFNHSVNLTPQHLIITPPPWKISPYDR